MSLARLARVVPVVLIVLTGCSSAADRVSHEPATGAGAPDRTAVGGPSAGTPAGAGRHAAPVEVEIPSIGVKSSLMELGLNTDGTVEVPPPDKGMTAGWYTGGAAPGESGTAVIIGHNDTRFGKAVFHDLEKLTKGADIRVRNSLGESARFTVTDSESVSKDFFPTEKVYGPARGHALRLITCDGELDADGHPVNNLIVYATLD
ncbi:class F sortase [Streptomyces sp. NPDC058653]|uniref:class F sortase n=1 Tax=Streptomyces sp. NPDC058653 TaxID=3346576 RepID=UPI003646EAA8